MELEGVVSKRRIGPIVAADVCIGSSSKTRQPGNEARGGGGLAAGIAIAAALRCNTHLAPRDAIWELMLVFKRVQHVCIAELKH